MKKHNFLSLISVFAILLSFSLQFAPSASALADPATIAASALVVEKSSGQVLYTKNEDEQVYPASTTKIMTALLVLEAADRGDIDLYGTVVASDTFGGDLAEDGSTVDIQPGEEMTVEELLNCVLISSANEACNILAEHVSGSIDTFVALMNERAEELGCTGTHFANPHGLPNENHYTTAHDMYLMFNEALMYPLFTEIAGTASKTLPMTNMSDIRVLENTDSLIDPDSEYYYEYANGGKTGYTKAAGQCLISSATSGDLELICVLMGANIRGESEADIFTDAPEENNFTAATALYEWAFANYSYQEVLTANDLVGSAPVLYGDGADSVGLNPEESIFMLLPNDYSAGDVGQTITLSSDTTGEVPEAPVSVGQDLGKITLTYGDRSYGPVKLVAASAVDLSRSAYFLSRLKSTLSQPMVIVAILVFVLLIVFYFIYVFKARAKKRRHRKNRSGRS